MTTPSGPSASSGPSAADDARIVARYCSLLACHGLSARSLDWGSRESQEVRFAVLAGVGGLSGASILDVGCGLADLHGWLLDQGVPHRYVGLDVTPDMAARAAARYPDIEVRQAEALAWDGFAEQSFDYVFASGLFYLRRQSPAAYLQATVARLFSWCRKGLAFNSLSAWAEGREPDEFYADPLETLAACRALASRLVLRHDYHPGDFTVYLYRGRAG